MRFFLVAFFLIYGSMHFYAIMKARCAFGFGPLSTILLTFFIITMLFAPIIVRMSEKVGLDKFAIVMAYVGYFWFGLFFLFFCASVLFDIWRLVVYLIGLTAGKDLSPITGAFRLYFYIAVLCAMSIACYGFFEAECIKTERIVIHTDKLPRGMNSLRIVQISDVHLGLIVREERLRKIIYEIKKAKPDMLVSTGDLFDGQTDSMNSLARLFMEVEPRFGKFAITGNHEFYAGISNFISFALESGFKVLRGDAVTIEGAINVAGVDDITGIHFHQYETVEEKRLLGGLDRDRFTLLLKHRPVIDKSALGLFDLQLSGHTHKGQIYPFYYIVRMVFPFTAGYYDLGGNSRLYVSRGTGIWGPPIRFMSPPEVTLIELRSGVNIPE